MESTISNLIFPRPANPSYGINTTLVDGYPEARLVHIRRRETHKYTFGFYVSQTLKYNFECEREKENFIQEQQEQRQYQYTYVGKTAAADEEEKKEESQSKDGYVASPLRGGGGGGGAESNRHNPYRDRGESDEDEEEHQVSNLRNSSPSASSPENTTVKSSPTQRDGSGRLSQARSTTTAPPQFVAPPPPPPPRYLVLYAHPNACDIGDMLYDASALSSMTNVDVLVWEFRGYGLCGGAASERELYLDMEAVYDFAENSLGVPSHQIILAGRSVGSGPSVQLAACLPTILNARRLASQRSEEKKLDAQRGELPLYRFDEEAVETSSSSSNLLVPAACTVPRRLPLAGLFLQGAFTSISDAVDSLIDFYSGSSGVLSYTKGITKGLAKKVVAERFRSVDIIPEVFSFEQQYYSKSETEKKNQRHHRGGVVGGEDGFPVKNNTVDGMAAVIDENTLALAKRIWLDTISNYCSPPFVAIQHGDKDEIVPHTHALGLMKAIEKRCSGGGGMNGSDESSSAANSSPSSRSYKTVYKGKSIVNLCTAEGIGHNDLSIEDAAAIILRDIIQPHTAMLEVLSAAYAHNESFLKTLDFPSPAVVSLVSVVEDVLPKYVVGRATGGISDPPASYFSTVYSKIVLLLGEEVEANEAANSTPPPLLLESARLRAGHGLLAMATSSASSPSGLETANEEGKEEEGGSLSTKTSSPSSAAASKVPGVNAPAFDEDGYLFTAKNKQQRQLAQSLAQSALISTGEEASTEKAGVEQEPSGREDFSLMVAGDGKRVVGVRSRTEAPEDEGFNPMGFANMAKELWKEPITTNEIKKKEQDADEEDEEDALAVRQATPTTDSATVPDEALTPSNTTEDDRVAGGGVNGTSSSKSPSTATTSTAVAVAKLSPLTRPTLSYWTRVILPSTDVSRFGAILLSSCSNSTATATAASINHGGTTKNASSFFRLLAGEAAKHSQILITTKRSCHALTAVHGAHREGKNTTTDKYPHALSTTPTRQQQQQQDSATSPLASANRHHTRTANTNSNSKTKNGCVVPASPFVALDLIAPYSLFSSNSTSEAATHAPPADNNDLLHGAHLFGQSLLAGNHPPPLLSSAILQKQLAAVLTTSVMAFTQHVAMRWLRMRAKRDLVQLRLRGTKTHAYGFSAGFSSSTTPTAASANGSIPPGLALAVVGAGNTAPGALPPTALPPLQSPREFVYEHLALFGSPFGVYLLPVIMGKDSNMRDGLETNRAEQEHNQKTAAKTKCSPPSPLSSGFHAVIFGSFVADPASLTAEEARREGLCEAGGAMLSPNTPYKCWYTHCVELSDERHQPDEAADANSVSNPSGGGNSSNGAGSVKSYSSSRRMKRMVERFPRVTMMELELTENILTTIERFLTTLDHKAALGDLTKVSSSSSSSFGHLSMQADDFLISGERHLDDLCGAMAVENSLMLLGESEVDRVQMECERLVLALTQREIEALTSAQLALTHTNNKSRVGDQDRLLRDVLIKAMPITTILCPFVRLLATKPPMPLANNKDAAVTGTTTIVTAATNTKEEEKSLEVIEESINDEDHELASSSMYDLDDTREGYLIPRLYGPSAFVSTTHMLLPPTVIVRLYKSFSHDFFNTTGDLSRVLADVKRRRLQFEACHPMYNVGGNASVRGYTERTMPDECQLDSLIFDLQSALLRNVPEGFCGSVGCGRYRDADEAVCLLQELCLKAFIEAETYKLPYSTCRTEVLKPSFLSKRERAEREEDGTDEEAFETEVEGTDGNCRFIASPVGGSDAAKRHVLLGRAEPADPCTRDALHWIMPPSNLSAAATESNNDCVIC